MAARDAGDRLMTSQWTAQVEVEPGVFATVTWTDGDWAVEGDHAAVIAGELELRTERALVGTGAGILPVDMDAILRGVVGDTFATVNHVEVDFEEDDSPEGTVF